MNVYHFRWEVDFSMTKIERAYLPNYIEARSSAHAIQRAIATVISYGPEFESGVKGVTAWLEIIGKKKKPPTWKITGGRSRRT